MESSVTLTLDAEELLELFDQGYVDRDGFTVQATEEEWMEALVEIRHQMQNS